MDNLYNQLIEAGYSPEEADEITARVAYGQTLDSAMQSLATV